MANKGTAFSGRARDATRELSLAGSPAGIKARSFVDLRAALAGTEEIGIGKDRWLSEITCNPYSNRGFGDGDRSFPPLATTIHHTIVPTIRKQINEWNKKGGSRSGFLMLQLFADASAALGCFKGLYMFSRGETNDFRIFLGVLLKKIKQNSYCTWFIRP